MTHKQLELKTKILLQEHFGNAIRVYDREVGVFALPYDTDKRITIGPVGAADLWAILVWDGLPVHLELEVKVGKDRLNRNQVNFKKHIDYFGGFYFVVHENNYEALPEIIENWLLEKGGGKHGTGFKRVAKVETEGDR